MLNFHKLLKNTTDPVVKFEYHLNTIMYHIFFSLTIPRYLRVHMYSENRDILTSWIQRIQNGYIFFTKPEGIDVIERDRIIILTYTAPELCFRLLPSECPISSYNYLGTSILARTFIEMESDFCKTLIERKGNVRLL